MMIPTPDAITKARRNNGMAPTITIWLLL